MDPLSIISGVVGIATAGTTLVSSLYTLVQTVRSAPRQMHEIAKEMTNLTSVLEHLIEIVSDGQDIATTKYLRGIKFVIGNIQATQDEIFDMIDDQSIMKRLRWGRAKKLIADIQAHKNTISIQISILTLGLVKKNVTHKVRSSERRLRKQAESLVQASQACLNTKAKEVYEDGPGHYHPPPPHVPLPPRRPSDEPSSNHQGLGGSHKQEEPPPPRSGKALGGEKVEYRDRQHSGGKTQGYPSPEASKNPIQTGPFNVASAAARNEARWDTLTPFDRQFRGDAATLLYNLVFAPDSDSGYETDKASYGDDDDSIIYSDGLVEIEELISSGEDVAENMRRQHKIAARRSMRQRERQNRTGKHDNPKKNGTQNNEELVEPSRIVNRLLLQWTSLTTEDIGVTDDASTNANEDHHREESIRDNIAAIVRAASFPLDDTEVDPGHSEAFLTSNSEWSESERRSTRSWSDRDFSRSKRHRPRNRGSGQKRAEEGQSYPRVSSRYHYREQPPPPPSTFNFRPSTGNKNNPFTPPNHTQQGSSWNSRDYSENMYPMYDNAYFQQYGNPWSYTTQFPFTPAPPWNSSKQDDKSTHNPFVAPDVLVLGESYEIDEGKNASVPRVDILNNGFKLERQRPDSVDVWNAERFMAENRLQGHAIMGALAGDKSITNESHLWETLFQGYGVPIIYTRGSDRGETWFLGATPVFILFYHASYQPQFFPAIGDVAVNNSQEYVAIGEQWICDEALKQLDIVPREKCEGKIILEPTVTTAEMYTLIKVTQSLVWLRHRRMYAKTFYQPLEYFKAAQMQRQDQASEAATKSSVNQIKDEVNSPIDKSKGSSPDIPMEQKASVPKEKTPEFQVSPEPLLQTKNSSADVAGQIPRTPSQEARKTTSSRDQRDDEARERRRARRGGSPSHRSPRVSEPSLRDKEGERPHRRRRRRYPKEEERSSRASDSGFASLLSFGRNRHQDSASSSHSRS